MDGSHTGLLADQYVPPGNGQFTYWSPRGPVCTACIGAVLQWYSRPCFQLYFCFSSFCKGMVLWARFWKPRYPSKCSTKSSITLCSTLFTITSKRQTPQLLRGAAAAAALIKQAKETVERRDGK
ncbi:hypothetical protein BHE74_00018969 [Ensete ventricosum]|nr:hypothetical protein BHE74_00018969 [Ensete ventricosum]RZS01177.1 hypothetical protein BHM03_00030991 [Ensete ventricosum]